MVQVRYGTKLVMARRTVQPMRRDLVPKGRPEPVRVMLAFAELFGAVE